MRTTWIYIEIRKSEVLRRVLNPRSNFVRDRVRYQLGDLLPAATGRMKSIYGKAKDAASSWDRRDAVDAIGERSALLIEAIVKANCEQWQVNTAVHYNTWQNLTASDFRIVVDAYRTLIRHFSCAQCNEYLRLFPEVNPDLLGCRCGGVNLPLNRKPPQGKQVVA